MHMDEKNIGASKARTAISVVYAIAVGLVAASLAVFGPLLVAFVAAWMFSYIGWTGLAAIASKIPTYFAFWIIFGVAVGLTTCLRILGRRFRKEPEPRSFR